MTCQSLPSNRSYYLPTIFGFFFNFSQSTALFSVSARQKSLQPAISAWKAIFHITAWLSGSYCCIARNCMGEAQSSAELTLEDIKSQLSEEEKIQLSSEKLPPRFVNGLKSVEAKINESLKLSVKGRLAHFVIKT